MLEYLLYSKSTTVYRAARDLDIPYTAINRIVKGTTDLNKASVQLLAKLSDYFHLSMDDLYHEYCLDKDIRESQWNAFVSSLQHRIRETGAVKFIRYCITSHIAEKCFFAGAYDKGLYVVSAVDYLCRIENIPLYDGYAEMRKIKLEEARFPDDIELIQNKELKEELKERCMKECIPEFSRANIMEKGLDHVI